MLEGVNTDVANPETTAQDSEGFNSKEYNFRQLEASREAEREARIRAEMEAEMMRRELSEIKNYLKPQEKDPLDEVEDYVDAPRLKAKLDKERIRNLEEAKKIAKQIYEEQKREDEKRNFLERLKGQFADYDQIMSEKNIANLEKIDPVFIETVCSIEDDYQRRLKTYKKLKSLENSKRSDDKSSIKEKIEENARNPYYVSPSSGSPPAVEFDLKSNSARKEAYERLKAAQRNPIGNSVANRN